MGCGEGRLSVGLAVDAARWLAYDADADADAEAVARRSLPANLAGRLSYQVGSAQELEIEIEIEIERG